jgi:hypothetical protein
MEGRIGFGIFPVALLFLSVGVREMSVFDSAPQLSIWAVQVTNLDHTKQPTLFCAASADPDLAVALSAALPSR